MPIQYCHFHGRNIDLDYDVEHFNSEARCLAELDELQEQHDKLFNEMAWEDQAHYGDARNKRDRAYPENKSGLDKRDNNKTHKPSFGGI